ncbi:MAG: fatty-acyl-CoA synthase [Kiritimatiellia bacterium]|jgi:fatty-acyl-CoA synthase
MNSFSTVSDAIAHIGEQQPNRGFTFQDMKGVETTHTFPQIEQQTRNRAAALAKLGLKKGDRAGVVIVEPEDFVLTFFAMFRLGVVPVPLYPPMSMGNLDSYAERTAMVLRSAEAQVLVASTSLQNVLWSLVDAVPTLRSLVKAEDLRKGGPEIELPTIVPSDTAFLQYTSGSTSAPKGVIVTHSSLVANCVSIMEHGLKLDADRGDIAVSWLPLYHDMGLIGFVITPILFGVPTVYIPTLRFIRRPTCWLETMHRHRACASFGPNFAYALVARKAKPADLDRWDLSCVRILGCGAEPIHPDTMRKFTKIFSEHCGLPTSAMLPAYGMAEATLAISLKPVESTMITRVVHADTFQSDGRVSEPVEGQPFEEHVSCGVPFPGHEVAIVDESGAHLVDGHQGEICVKGPSVTPGYFKNPDATAAAFRDGWLHTGDLGYMLDNNIFVTGRVKDLVILNGRNVHPQAIEWLAANVEGVRKGNVVAFSRPGSHSEELVVALETRIEDHQALGREVRKAVQKGLALAVSEVICLKPGTLPKTSSGKLQRSKTRGQYLRGVIGKEGNRTAGSTDRVTLARHMAKSVWSRAKAALRD